MTVFRKVPKEKTLDGSFSLLTEGYLFIQNRCREFQADLFETRLLGEKVVCMSGRGAAEIFYDTNRFVRKGAAPKRVQKTLFGVEAVQAMDGAPHQHRKLLFMSLMTPEAIKKLGTLVSAEWKEKSRVWIEDGEAVLFEEAQDVLCRAACKWAGVPLKDDEARERAKDFALMVDAFGAVGPRHWEGRRARKRSEDWISGLIEEIRSSALEVPQDSAAYAMAFHKELDGSHLDTRMAAIELINVLRPITAIAYYAAFSAHALHLHPEYKEQIRDGSITEMFVQEVRRYYPFGPFLGARVKENFTWNSYEFEEDQLVLLDIYGTNHDPRCWEEPEKFKPERFKDRAEDPFDFIPQGGGSHMKGHRCPGEWITIEALEATLRFLVSDIDYTIDDQQNFSISLTRMPALPKSRIVLSQIKAM